MILVLSEFNYSSIDGLRLACTVKNNLDVLQLIMPDNFLSVIVTNS